jgi:hypothetical protein
MQKNTNDFEEILEDIDYNLNTLRGLQELLSDYFCYSTDYAIENPVVMAAKYGQYGSLNHACRDTVDKILSAVRELADQKKS